MQNEKIQIFVEKLSRPVARGGAQGHVPPFYILRGEQGGGTLSETKKEKMKK